MLVDVLDALVELALGLALDALDLLEGAALDELLLGLRVVGEGDSELGADVLEDLFGGVLEQRVERGQVAALADDGLERAFAAGLRLWLLPLVEVVVVRSRQQRLLVQVQLQQRLQDPQFRQGLRVVRRVLPDLLQRLRALHLQLHVRSAHQRVLYRLHAPVRNYRHRQVVVRPYVLQPQNPWRDVLLLRLVAELHHVHYTFCVSDHFGEIVRVL